MIPPLSPRDLQAATPKAKAKARPEIIKKSIPGDSLEGVVPLPHRGNLMTGRIGIEPLRKKPLPDMKDMPPEFRKLGKLVHKWRLSRNRADFKKAQTQLSTWDKKI